jgi:hypothetical protein
MSNDRIDDLTGRIVTGRYQTWRPEDGTPVRITVGSPRFWHNRAPLADGRRLAPWGLMDPNMPEDECRQRYEARLDALGDEVVTLLARLVTEYPGERLVLCCFEDVHGGDDCHRRWLAAWLEARYGLDVPELDPARGLNFSQFCESVGDRADVRHHLPKPGKPEQQRLF